MLSSTRIMKCKNDLIISRIQIYRINKEIIMEVQVIRLELEPSEPIKGSCGTGCSYPTTYRVSSVPALPYNKLVVDTWYCPDNLLRQRFDEALDKFLWHNFYPTVINLEEMYSMFIELNKTTLYEAEVHTFD